MKTLITKYQRNLFLLVFFVNLITSEIYRSACLRSSPINKTMEVVPSPVISSCAVAARAINDAVGC
jgi:hypothetical protein